MNSQDSSDSVRSVEEANIGLGRLLKRGDVAVLESTVYPGATGEACVPIMQDRSGLVIN